MNRLPMVIAAALLCGACSKTPETPKVPDAPAPKIEAPAVSDVQDVKPMPAPRTTEAAPNPGDRTQTHAGSTMTREEQSAAMPMPGQANDHSVPQAKSPIPPAR